MKRKLAYATVLLGALCIGTAGHSADLMTPEARPVVTPEGWTFTFAPYFWAAGISGDTRQLGLPEVHLDSDFGDILKNLDFAFMATGEARYDRYSLFGDIIYTKLGASARTPNGVLADSVNVETKTFSALVGAGYSIWEDQSSHLDIVGGVKIWSVDTALSFDGGILGGIQRDDSATWVDAMAGFRGNYFFTPEIYLTGWGLVGGGGADIDWDVALGLGYKFNDRISAVAGYRALGVNYDSGGFEFDTVQQGPIIGMAIHF